MYECMCVCVFVAVRGGAGGVAKLTSQEETVMMDDGPVTD